MNIIKTRNIKERKAICYEILSSLPEWFSDQNEIIERVKSCENLNKDFFFAFDDRIRGFLVLSPKNSKAYEIETMAVFKTDQRRGVGHFLLDLVKYLYPNRAIFTKTLDDSVDNVFYNQTKSFFTKEGFVKIATRKNEWHKGKPAMILALPLIKK